VPGIESAGSGPATSLPARYWRDLGHTG